MPGEHRSGRCAGRGAGHGRAGRGFGHHPFPGRERGAGACVADARGNGVPAGLEAGALPWTPAGGYPARGRACRAAVEHVRHLQYPHSNSHQRLRHGHSGGLDGARQGGRLLLDDIGRVRYFHHHLCRAELRRAEVRPHPQERTGVPCAWLRQRCADERAVLLSGAVSAGPVHQGRRGGVHRPGHGAAAGAVLLHICLH